MQPLDGQAPAASDLHGFDDARGHQFVELAAADAEHFGRFLGAQEQALERAGWISVGTCVAGSMFGSDFLRNVGLGGAAVAFGVKYLTRAAGR